LDKKYDNRIGKTIAEYDDIIALLRAFIEGIMSSAKAAHIILNLLSLRKLLEALSICLWHLQDCLVEDKLVIVRENQRVPSHHSQQEGFL
jgi:hypothetical protein